MQGYEPSNELSNLRLLKRVLPKQQSLETRHTAMENWSTSTDHRVAVGCFKQMPSTHILMNIILESRWKFGIN